MSNISFLLCLLEPLKKFTVVVVVVVVDTTVNIVFSFGPRLGLKTEVWAQAEQNVLCESVNPCLCL